MKHDPLLYEDAGGMVEYVASSLEADLQRGGHIAHVPALDSNLQKTTKIEDRVFCFHGEHARGSASKAEAKLARAE